MSRASLRSLAFTLLLGAGALGLRAADAPAAPADAGTAPTTARAPRAPADQPSVKKDRNGEPNADFLQRHDAYVELAKKGGIDLYFEGDSLTDFWRSQGKEVWQKEFAGWKAENFGISGDRTEHVLWRLDNGELDGVHPKVFVLMIGTNNLGLHSNAQIVAGNAAILKEMRRRCPNARILLLGIFPRGEKADNPARQRIKDINAGLAKLDDGGPVKFLDIGGKFLQADGTISNQVMHDFLHPTARGYDIWAAAIKPILTQWLGEPGPAGASQ